MQPAAQFPAAAARSLSGVLFDLDDTVLDHGRLSVAALTALYQLAQAGLILVGVTGRPAGWGQVLARQWPVSGMVTENGIIALSQRERRMQVLDRASPAERAARSQRLAELASELSTRFPQLQPSDDMPSRIADYTFDIAESRQVDAGVVQAAMDLARERGARVVRSSIHLHLSYDGDDKASGAVRFLQLMHGLDATAARHRFAFIGDSDNDAPCFGAFEHTFGVANLRGRPSLLPAYRASQPMGAGFAELAQIILERRALR
ncbi:MAG TPA: HAD-IIB family hydrolase [Polyangiaceae bacterium]|nr:HAD-IIB family hydrolase [Polyangiaceae bacterium]